MRAWSFEGRWRRGEGGAGGAWGVACAPSLWAASAVRGPRAAACWPHDTFHATLPRKINACAQIEHAEGGAKRDWFAPIVADAEAGFGGPLNCYELMKAMIEAGAAGVHFEDQLSSEKKCGHLGGKVLVPTSQFVRALVAARLAADVAGVPTVLIARTDALSAGLLTSDVDERDRAFCTGERTAEGFFRVKDGIEAAIARGLAYAPHADMLWVETSTPDLEEARQFAEAIHARFPGKLLAYNCSPSFNWRRHLDEATIANFQKELGAMGRWLGGGLRLWVAGLRGWRGCVAGVAVAAAADALTLARGPPRPSRLGHPTDTPPNTY